jgi:1,4-alpha-glucan branching enzyme
VREGRKREFAKFARFGEEGAEALPDPTDPATFEKVKLNWSVLNQPSHAGWLEHYRRLLAIRQRDIVPLIPEISRGRCVKLQDSGAFAVDWATKNGSTLHLIANLSDQTVPLVGKPAGRQIFATHPNIRGTVKRNMLEPWSVTWLLERTHA